MSRFITVAEVVFIGAATVLGVAVGIAWGLLSWMTLDLDVELPDTDLPREMGWWAT